MGWAARSGVVWLCWPRGSAKESTEGKVTSASALQPGKPVGQRAAGRGRETAENEMPLCSWSLDEVEGERGVAAV